jgi:hypothetical protein
MRGANRRSWRGVVAVAACAGLFACGDTTYGRAVRAQEEAAARLTGETEELARAFPPLEESGRMQLAQDSGMGGGGAEGTGIEKPTELVVESSADPTDISPGELVWIRTSLMLRY